MKRGFWLFVGFLSLFLGIVGVVLPVLPTTPFVILAAFAFGRSVPRLRIWLEESRTFGPMIANWQEHGAIATRYKITAIMMMAGALAVSLLVGASTLILSVQLLCMIAAGMFILTRPNA